MKPLSDFTTPRRLICPISRHFFPVEQPDPVGCCTTGLKKGSRFPFIAHFFSSGFGGLEASAPIVATTGFSSGAILVVAATAGLVAGAAAGTIAGFGAGLFAATTGAAAAGAGFVGTNTSCGLAAAVTGAATLFAAGTTAGTTTGLTAAVCALGAGIEVFAGTGAGLLLATTVLATSVLAAAGALFATPGATPCVCRVKIKVLPGPGVNSYARACSRSTTTLVVGGVLPSIPMRTALTPALPTGILLCAVAMTVAGSSTTTRAGELSLSTFGVTASRELISMRTSSALRTTFTFCKVLFWLAAGAGTDFTAAWAGAAAGFATGIVAGFTASAGAPGAGLAGTAAAATTLLDCVFAVPCTLLMMLGFCAHAAPVIMTTARMPVVSFISDSYLPAGLVPGPATAGVRS